VISEMPEYLNENLFTLQTEISQKQKILTVAKKYKALLEHSGNSFFFDNKLIKHKSEIHFSNIFFDFETYKFVPHYFTEFQFLKKVVFVQKLNSLLDLLFLFCRLFSFFFLKLLEIRI
jgi:hypothetical protein